jgi:hypothetical protein
MAWDIGLVDEAASLLLEGKSQREAAAQMSERIGAEVTVSALANVVSRARPDVAQAYTERREKRESARKELLSAVCADYSAGLYYKEITAKHGVNSDFIEHAVRAIPGVIEQRRRITNGRSGSTSENYIVRSILGKRKRFEHFDVPPDPLTDAGKVLVDLGRCECRWPIGRDSGGVQRFCAEAVEPERSYCSEHYKRSDCKFGSIDEDIKQADFLFWRDTGNRQCEPPTLEQQDEVIRVQLGGEDVDCRGYGRSAFDGSQGIGESDEAAPATV